MKNVGKISFLIILANMILFSIWLVNSQTVNNVDENNITIQVVGIPESDAELYVNNLQQFLQNYPELKELEWTIKYGEQITIDNGKVTIGIDNFTNNLNAVLEHYVEGDRDDTE